MKGELTWSKSKIAEYISNDSELAEIAPPEINFTDERWWGCSQKDFLDYVEKEVEIKELLFFFLIQVYELPLEFSSKEFNTVCLLILKILTTLNDKFSSLNCLALEPEIVLIKTLDSCLYNLIRGMLEKWQCIKENECTMRGEILCWLLRKYITITYNIKGE